MANRTIAIFGGSGFVGRHLANRLVRDGYRLRIPTRSRERSRELWVLPTAEIIRADIHNLVELDRLLAGCACAVNLVGILNERRDDGAEFRHVHVDLTQKILTACKRQGIRRYVHVSALNASEQAPSRYLRSKGAAETLIGHIAAADGIHYTVFRPSVIFGPDDDLYNRFARLLGLTPVLPLACPGARFAPVYVGDVVEAIVRVLDMPASFGASYDLCGPEICTLREIVAATARMRNLRRWILPLGPVLARLQARAAELLPGKPFSRDNLRSLGIDNVCTGRDGLAALGIAPTPVRAVMPASLQQRTQRSRYLELRRH
jgi:NADH dehydrogenase